MQRLFIPGRLPGLNELLEAKATFGRTKGGSGKAWNGYAALKADMGQRVLLLAQSQKLRSVQRAYFTYVFREEDRKRDPSNFVAGGMKIIEDALKVAGILPGDGWKVVLGFAPHWLVDLDHPGVTVFLDEERLLERSSALAIDNQCLRDMDLREYDRRERNEEGQARRGPGAADDGALQADADGT